MRWMKSLRKVDIYENLKKGTMDQSNVAIQAVYHALDDIPNKEMKAHYH